jgi:hypothetical protein
VRRRCTCSLRQKVTSSISNEFRKLTRSNGRLLPLRGARLNLVIRYDTIVTAIQAAAKSSVRLNVEDRAVEDYPATRLHLSA